MILAQTYLGPLRLNPCYEWRITGSNKMSLVGLKCRFTCLNYYTECTGEGMVHCSSGHPPQLVSCGKWSRRNVSQPKCRMFSDAVVRAVGISQTEGENRCSHEELGRYGIDEFDYAGMRSPPQRPPIFDERDTSPAKTVAKIKAKKGVALKRKTVRKTVSEPKDGVEDTKGTEDPEHTKGSEASENDESAEAEGNEWCVYLILSNDKRRTYMGATANITRRLRQHNGELAGGAKSTRGGRPWSLVCTMRGLSSRSEAQQIEWRLRKFSKEHFEFDDALCEEVPANYRGLNVVVRRWAAFKKVHEIMKDWKHMQVQWY